MDLPELCPSCEKAAMEIEIGSPAKSPTSNHQMPEEIDFKKLASQ